MASHEGEFWYALSLRSIVGLLLASAPLAWGQLCGGCHPRETAGYAGSAMAHSLAPSDTQPNGSFKHAASRTRFESRVGHDGTWQSFTRGEESSRLPVAYAIGSGNHAVGFLVRVGDHLFQSPISYYTKRRLWDMAPGYEQASDPDFSRPVTIQCLICHSDQPLPVPETLNTYQEPAFAGGSIACDRCHGPTEAHLRKPSPGSIINPVKLSLAVRDSICEQCHLAGEIRIPNPGKAISDFRPGQRLEDVFTVYVSGQPGNKEIKVISHAEQLAQSLCARRSNGRMWCGTCHDPHNKPAEPVTFYRERCLTCHATALPASHGAPERNCTRCHMPQRPAKDGGHTAFTDHRIRRRIDTDVELPPGSELTAWRDPAPELSARNLALAFVTLGLQNGQPDSVIRGFRVLSHMEPSLENDPMALTELGTVILTGKEPKEAALRFRRALQLRPHFAPYEVNLGAALLEQGELTEATHHLEHALELDPLLAQGVRLLTRAYRQEGQPVKAELLLERYRAAMHIAVPLEGH